MKNKNTKNDFGYQEQLKRKKIRTGQDTATITQPQGEKNQKNNKSLRVIPLGGLGEIGKNLTVYEYGEDIIIVDMGMMFPDDEMLGVDYIIPDVIYLENKKKKIKGVFITHAHEDHIGAIPYLLPKLGMPPIYAPKLTAGLIESKLQEYASMKGVKINVINPDEDKLKLGEFEIEWVRVAHSIPDAVGIVINTPEGRIIYTGDFRFDHSPVDGRKTDIAKLSRLGQEGVLALFSDSTNSEEPGFSTSEKELKHSFDQIFSRSSGRIIVASFASQINRIQLIANAARDHGRKLAFSGRSLLNNIEVAVRLGYLKIPDGIVIKIQDVNKYPPEKVAIMSTGSQGEAMSALSRMAAGEHRQIKIKKGDTVIFSSSPIPGNESKITGVIDDLFRKGAEVVFDEKNGTRTHTSGHPGQEELKLMIELVNPKYHVPFHGEVHHLVHHAELAENLGIPKENIFTIDNGDILEISKGKIRKSDKKARHGVILVDGLGIGDVGEIVLRDRKAMATEGIFVVICTVERKTGKLLTSPDIISRGFIYMRENEQLVNNTRNEVKRYMERRAWSDTPDWPALKTEIREKVSQYLYNHTQRTPMVIPVIIQV